MEQINNSEEQTAPAYIKVMRVPVWVVRVASGMLVILGSALTVGLLVSVLWMMYLTAGVIKDRNENKRFRQELINNTEKASKERQDAIIAMEIIKEELKKIKKEQERVARNLLEYNRSIINE